MARTAAEFPGGTRLSDYLSVSVIARVYPREAVRTALQSLNRDSRRRRDLPAEVMVYYVIAMALFRAVSSREVLRCLVDGLRWISPSPSGAGVGQVVDLAGTDASGCGTVHCASRQLRDPAGAFRNTRRVVPGAASRGF